MHKIIDNSSAHRYEMPIDGKLALANYRLEGNKLSITHVETPPELRGQGVAAELMKFIVDDAKARNLTIVPVCPYAVAYLKRHPL